MKHWERFKKAQDSRLNEKSLCHGCPFGEKFEYPEKLKYPKPYRHLSNFRDDCLIHDGYKPKVDSGQCKLCFDGWLEERKAEGKICVRCGEWVGKRFGMKIVSESRWEDGRTYKETTTVCEPCLL